MYRGAHRRARVPAPVRAAVLAHAAVLVLSVFAWPVHRAPDEPQHVDLVVAVADGAAVPWPDPGRLRQSRGISAGVDLYARGQPVFLAAQAPGRWPSWASAGGAAPGPQPNQLVQHPPLYYLLLGAPLALLPGWPDWPYDVLLDVLRLASALILVPLPLLAWAAARRLVGDVPIAAACGVAMLGVPHLQHIGASVNNDGLLIVLAAAVTVPLVGVVRGDTRWRTAGLVGVLTGGALLTKGTALVLLPVVGAAYLLAWRRTSLLRTVRAAVVAAGLAVGLGGWWWIRNKLRYGAVQPNGLIADQTLLGRRPVLTSAAESGARFVSQFARRMSENFWLEPAVRPRPPFVSWTSWALSLLAAALLLAGSVAAVRARGAHRLRLSEVGWLLLPAAGILTIVLSGSWAAWKISLLPSGQQGRYLYPASVGLALLVALGLHALAGRRVVLATAACAATLQAVMGAVVVTQSWLPRTGDPLASRLWAAWRGWDAWSPLPWPALALLLLTAAGTLGALVAVAARQADDPAEPVGGDVPTVPRPAAVGSG
ncbi:MAG TPA: glycosyltransferase family 39 protein [Mycobacteriales bacterium]|nr:glycosyltransferase family 39 protein [Mycobacteriales bacterium]